MKYLATVNGTKFEVDIKEPNVNILAVQGPLSDDLMAKLFGEEISHQIIRERSLNS